MLDEATDHSWSFFLKEKSDLGTEVMKFIKDLKEKHSVQVKRIRCDNAGKNRSLETMCKQEGLGIQFEYTAPGTPQQNGCLERKFATLYGQLRVMSHSIDNRRLGTEAANIATVLDDVLLKWGQKKK